MILGCATYSNSITVLYREPKQFRAAPSASAILPIALSRNPTPPGCPWPVEQGAVARGKVACACVAPPVNFWNDGFSSSRYDDRSSAAEGLGVAPMPEDDLDVLIECSRDVCKSFGEKHILKGVSFKIRHGEAVGIIGPSGTGKSTILKIIVWILGSNWL
ncbi:hypothetical protein MLD38_035839 [Melastoma candidum]|uniref:Uncharacterized protein n=1 Tax=Melastoma candidum TaxID=119954 RepID=A0ACB9LJM8_9MYRT|nr:hypothetical protein MLD38_035839 [Melastoma candidum]